MNSASFRPNRRAKTMIRDTVQRMTDVSPRKEGEIFVVGGGHLGHDIARRLVARGQSVTVIDSTPMPEPPAELTVERVDVLDGRALSPVGLADDATVLAFSESDGTNLLLAQLARSRYDVDRILVRVNDPRRESAFENLDVEVVSVHTTLGRSIVDDRL